MRNIKNNFLQWNKPNVFQAKFFPKITKQFQPLLICFHCTGSKRIIQEKKIHARNDVHEFYRCFCMMLICIGCNFPERTHLKTRLMLIDPSMCTALNCILLRNVHSTNGWSNFITDFDLEVLFFIIVTKAILSTLNKCPCV